MVAPLAAELRKAGLPTWYDEFELRVGDSLRRRIDIGLAQSRFGVVVLSPAFFAKNWPQYELDALVAREMDGARVILPIWHRITKTEILRISPSLADRVALSTDTLTIKEIAEKISATIRIPT